MQFADVIRLLYIMPSYAQFGCSHQPKFRPMTLSNRPLSHQAALFVLAPLSDNNSALTAALSPRR